MSNMYDYWLCSIPGVGNRTIGNLRRYFGCAEEVYRASAAMLENVLKPGQLEAVEKMRKHWDLNGEFETLKGQGICFLTEKDNAYPIRLKEIPDAPYGLFYRGRLPEENQLSVAIIGARDCSRYGREVAWELGWFLGKNRVQVVSGMARGIDGISQEAALEGGGTTTAVLGCGVDICYPAQNRSLYDRMLEKGCVLSAYPPGTQPRPQNFPPRNRIVSGLADAIVVVEARNQSGTLITVDMALEQGKDVYVVPGRITDRLSDGCNKLIRQGAQMMLSSEEFLEDISKVWMDQRGGKSKRWQDAAASEAERTVEQKSSSCPEGEKKLPGNLQPIYDLLDLLPKSPEQLMKELSGEMNIIQLNTGLMRLCLMGLAEQETPGYFTKK